MLLSTILKRSRRSFSVGLIASSLLLHMSVMAQPKQTPEHERLNLIQALQARLPGTHPADWTIGGDVLALRDSGSVLAVPFNDNNATNSADILAIGKKLWDRKFKDGKSLANCFPNGGKRTAATYPQYDTKGKQVVTVAMALNRCLRLHAEPEIDATNAATWGPLSAYFVSLSEGQRLAVRASNGNAMDKFTSGKVLFQQRIGQQNFACASCHVRNAGESLGASRLSPVVGQAATWPRVEPGGTVRTLQMQFRVCMKKSGAEPFELGSEELNNLEYFVAYMSNGFAIRPMTIHRE